MSNHCHVRDQQLTSSQWKKNVKDIEGEVLCGMLLHLTIYLEHC